MKTKKEKWQHEALKRLDEIPKEELQRIVKEVKAMNLGGPTIEEYLIATGNEDLLIKHK